VVEAVQKSRPSVVSISSEKKAASSSRWPFSAEESQRPRVSGMGTGVILDGRGYILTNHHVVDKVQGIEVHLLDGSSYPARLLQFDEVMDLAIIKVDSGQPLPAITIGTSSDLMVGEEVITIGNAFGYENTVSVGIISALNRNVTLSDEQVYRNLIQTDACINPGNSGGPLIDGAGEVIGINSQIESQSGGNEGVGFAVPIKTAADVASQLENGGQVHQAYLGISGGDITPEIAHALNLPVTQGVLIERVLSGGPADDAGIKGATGQATISGQTFPVGGDIITKVDGKPISGMDDVVSAVNDHKPGDEITLTIFSGGQQKDVTVKLGDRPDHVQDSNSSSLP
jgi:serine protease Do